MRGGWIGWSGIWYLVFGIWYLVFGIWCLVFGVWWQANDCWLSSTGYQTRFTKYECGVSMILMFSTFVSASFPRKRESIGKDGANVLDSRFRGNDALWTGVRGNDAFWTGVQQPTNDQRLPITTCHGCPMQKGKQNSLCWESVI